MTRDDWVMVRAPASVAGLAIAVAIAGCGGGGYAPPRTTPPKTVGEPRAAPPQQPGLPSDLRVPDGVPRHSTGPADPQASRVIRAWLRALRAGDIARAASYFAEPSVVQNATPVLTLDTEMERMAFNDSFPCGAVATRIGSAGRFAVVTFRLTERAGGDCKGAAGHRAIGAIRVARHKIVEWYRLWLPSDPPLQVQPRIDPGPDKA